MHLLATRPGGYAAGDGVVDLGQAPADVVILSAADTDLALLAEACERAGDDLPSLRLASLLALRSNASVDLYFDSVLNHARVVVVAMMGGTSYWPYGVERLVERAREGAPHAMQLVLVPGDDTADPELARLSTVSPAECERIWRYLREGGPDNARALLQFVAARFFDAAPAPAPPQIVPRTAIYHPRAGLADLARWQREWRAGAPVAALVFYRAHLQAGNLAAFDALIERLAAAGMNPLPISVSSLKDEGCRVQVEALLQQTAAEIVLNTTGFSISSFEAGGARSGALGRDRPVLQVIMSGGNIEDWREGSDGLSPRDLAMSVVLPETDGRIITRAVSWKGRLRRCERAETDVIEYRVEPDRAAFVVELAARWVALARTPAAERRVAFVLANYPARDGRLGNGVGLDTPASIVAILRALAGAGYAVADVPEDGGALIRRLLGHVTNELAPIDARPSQQSLALAEYIAFLGELPAELGRAIEQRWGPPELDPRFRAGRMVIAGVQLGATFVGIQPARGYEIDVSATYHDPDLVPPHGYLAFYAWLRRVYSAHAIVHVGKHGNLEWLPGKSVALGPSCWPDAIFGPMPHLYPFIVNDPGEGAQAKRRAQAVIIDHLVPPLTRAESYGALRDLERLVDEYYQALMLDPPRAAVLRREILSTARAAKLDRELEGVRPRREEAGGDPDDALLVSIDAYLCELKESQIRDGLHVFGQSPLGAQRLDTLVALARLPTRAGHGADDGLLRALSRAFFEAMNFDPLTAEPASVWDGPRPDALLRVSDEAWRSAGDTRERLELFARAVLAGEAEPPAACASVIARIRDELAPTLDACGAREIAGLLAGLDGRFVEPGPSGAPTRGRLDVLPTGRNFYTVDVRAVPTPAAYRLGERAAERVVQRHVQDHGEYPRCIGLSVWGTASMRTGGDDIAQALALLGVRPVWAEGSGRVVDTEILPPSVLRRPRVDVVLRISGFFRDAFPELIRIFDYAVRAVAELDEPEHLNPVRARVLRDESALCAQGLAQAEAARKARFRVFGSKPGAYGAGLGGVIDQGNWRDRRDLAELYLDFGCYAYAAADSGVSERELLSTRLRHVEAVLHNQDNREHDLLDSDDYYQFQGGMSAAIEALRGEPVALYHGDHANPEAPRIRSLREELARVVRSRVVNPKWIAGARRHGYKGAAEMAATVEFLFGFSAATDVVGDHQYALVSDAYLRDPENQAFLFEHNPVALREMTERMLEAIQRGMWREPGDHESALTALLLDAEEAELDFPWSAVVGQDALKQALLLCAIDPAIGGVLVQGPRGVAKTTLARGLAELVPGEFVELPLGATEERVAGTLNLELALRAGRVEFAPGLLSRAHEGVLYVDEVNLLPDALVDLLLDAAATGRNIVERDGVSHAHAARFVLVGSMNPDEGELRPQLIDRFGLSVSAHGRIAPDERAQIVLRRLAFDRDPEGFRVGYAERQAALAERCRRAAERASAISLDGPALAHVAELCHAAGVEGVRADLAMLRAARAHAAWHDRTQITVADVDAVAELALAHRRPREDDPGRGGEPGGAAPAGGGAARSDRGTGLGSRGLTARDALSAPQRAQARGAGAAGAQPGRGSDPDAELDRRGALPARPVRAAVAPELPRWLRAPRGSRPGRTRRGAAQLSAAIGSRARDRALRGAVDWFATLRSGRRPRPDQVRYRARRMPAAQLWIVAVDCSSSMLNSGGLSLAKGIAHALEHSARNTGARLALISFRGPGAQLEVDSSPGRAVLPRAIAGLGGGGGTPLGEALRLAQSLCKQARWRAPGVFKRLIVLTDGRVRDVARRNFHSSALPADLERVVVDCELGRVRLGRSAALAAALGGVRVVATDLHRA